MSQEYIQNLYIYTVLENQNIKIFIIDISFLVWYLFLANCIVVLECLLSKGKIYYKQNFEFYLFKKNIFKTFFIYLMDVSNLILIKTYIII